MAAILNFDFQKWCQIWTFHAKFGRKSCITRVSMSIFIIYNFNMAAGGHLEFWCSDSPKYKKGVINRLPMPHLVGKVVLHRFLCPFIFKFHFQYGHLRAFWILASPKFRCHFREGHGSSFFSKYPKELKSNVEPYYALGGHGTPRYHPTATSPREFTKLLRPVVVLLMSSCTST